MKVWARSCAATFVVAMGGLALATSASAQQLNVICSVQAEWCTLAATEFEKETGIKVEWELLNHFEVINKGQAIGVINVPQNPDSIPIAAMTVGSPPNL